MPITRRDLLATSVAASTLPRAGRAQPAPRQRIRIGVLNDLSGPYRDTGGPSSVNAARLAVADFGGSTRGFEVEVLFADHQNKADIGATIARGWIDSDGVDAIADVPNSAVALAVAEICRQKDRVLLDASATSVVLTGEQCSPNTIVWSFDTYTFAKSTGSAIVRGGGDTWYILTANYAFGHSLEEMTSDVVKAAQGRVLGTLRYPFPDTTDFSSYLQQAQASGAKVLGLANAGLDTVNCIKQAHEFGLNQSMIIAPLQMFICDVHALGPETAGGLAVTATFYWDLNDRTRAFTKRFLPGSPTNYPAQSHASCYAAVLHYLKVVADMGPVEAKKSGRAAVERMKATPTEDDAFGKGSIRADGRGVFPAYLFTVKTPAESKGDWDLYKLTATTPAEQAVRPLAEGHCAFVRL